MPPITFFVPGDPKAQPRPRAFARKFGDKWQARVYDAGTAEHWKGQIALAAKPLVDGVTLPLFAGPVSLALHFTLRRPKGHYRKKGTELRDGAPQFHTGRPDVDNFAKAVMDALTAVGIWADDGQVARMIVEKRYESHGRMYGCQITIEEL